MHPTAHASHASTMHAATHATAAAMKGKGR
jgi:hypothetical protein